MKSSKYCEVWYIVKVDVGKTDYGREIICIYWNIFINILGITKIITTLRKNNTLST